MNFVALDFETANEQRDSACSIGLTTVSDGKVVASDYHLIRPPELRFSHWNTKVHGLCEADVSDSPTFAELWPSIRHLIEDKLIVAHNASFDTSVLRHTLCTASIEMPRISYLCSLNVARRAWPNLVSHSLGFLAQSLGLELEHHNAASDARAAANIVLLAANQNGHNCPFELAESLGVYIGEIFSHDEWVSCSSPRTLRDSQSIEIVLPDGYDISQHPFFGKNIEFTGKLDLFKRDEAERIVSRFGGTSKGNVSKQTNYLVIGALDIRTLAEGASESTKIQKSAALREKGCDIQIISEADFGELVFSPVMPRTEGVNKLQEQLFDTELTENEDIPDTSSSTPIQWLLRSYQTSVEWKAKARAVFFSSNGDSNLARNRVAGIVRSYFIENKNRLEPENIGRWKDGENVIENHHVVPPKVSESNSTYVDWVYIADFLLLPLISLLDELETENRLRVTEYENALRSYKKRVAVEEAREVIRQDSNMPDDVIWESLKSRHPEGSLAAVKFARKLEKTNAKEPKAKEPKPSVPLPNYKSLYFPSV